MQVPTGRVKWYDTTKGFGFLSRDDGSDVFLHKSALPANVTELEPGARVEFGIVAGRKGDQALTVRVLDEPPSLPTKDRPSPDELHSLIEDMIKVLDTTVEPHLRRGRYPDRRTSKKVADAVHAVARALEG